jgi:hypothetical protein
LHSHVGKQQSDGKRLAGSGLLLLGSTMLALSLLIMGTLQWGWPSACHHASASTPLALVGLIIGLWGYRLASGTWVGSLQVPHRATAMAGLLFLGYFVRATVVNAPRPQSPPAWIMSIALLALLSWCFAARRRGSWR